MSVITAASYVCSFTVFVIFLSYLKAVILGPATSQDREHWDPDTISGWDVRRRR